MNDLILKKTFGTNVQRLRKRSALTQSELALHLNTSPSQIAKIETGNSGASFKMISNLIQVFQCTCSELFEEQLSPPAKEAETHFEILDGKYQHLKAQIEGLEKAVFHPQSAKINPLLLELLPKMSLKAQDFLANFALGYLEDFGESQKRNSEAKDISQHLVELSKVRQVKKRDNKKATST